METEKKKDQLPLKSPKVDRPMWAFSIGALIVLAMFFISYKVASMGLVTDFSQMSVGSIFWEQLMFSAFVLVLPAWILSRNFIPNASNFFKIKKAPNWKLVFLFFAVFFSANFFLNWLVNFNEMIPLPSAMKTVFDHMQSYNESLQESVMKFDSFGSFLLIFLVLAIFPAVSEELFFRGFLQGSLKKAGISYHHAVIIAALLFALLHVQFYNLLAIFFMGLLLGYAYHFTKNIWIPILGHLFNNGLIVVLGYLHHLGYIPYDLETDPPFLVSLIGMVLFVGFLYMFVQQSQKSLNQKSI